MFPWTVYLSAAFLFAIFENAGVMGTSKVQKSSAGEDPSPEGKAFHKDKRAFKDQSGKPKYNLTYCSFNLDSCGFQDYTKDNDYKLQITRRKYMNYYRGSPMVDRSWGSATTGYFMGIIYTDVSNFRSRYDPGSKATSATIKSPYYGPTDHSCLMFWYNLETKYNTKISIDVPTEIEGGVSYPVLHLDTTTNYKWKLAQFDLDEEYSPFGYKVLFKFNVPARAKNHIPPTYAAIDDVYVYDIACSDVPKHPRTKYVFKTTNFTSYYTFHMEMKDWESAFLTCRKEGAMSSLVSVETQKEQEYLVRMIQNDAALSQAGMNGGFYTSGNDIANDRTFLWSGNYGTEKFNYTNWKPGQPNNVKGDQDCVALEYSSLDYSWGDVNCSKPLSFICETRLPTNGVGEEYLG